MRNRLLEIIKKRALVIDGAMGTQLQLAEIKPEEWLGENGEDLEGCNELLNATAPHVLQKIYGAYAKADADFITTNTFGSMPWVLDEYGIGERSYELSKKGVEIAKEVCNDYSTPQKPRFVLGSVGPGTKLPSLGHIDYDEMYEGYKIMAQGMIDGAWIYFYLKLVKTLFKSKLLCMPSVM